MNKYRIQFEDNGTLVTTIQTTFTNDIDAAHAIASALRDAKFSVEVWVWTRKQRKELTARGCRWHAGYVITGI